MIRERIQGLKQDSLYRNSFFLMLTTAIVSGLGFVFWLITARLFSTEEIGLATTLISTMNLIAILSLLGFNTAFIRFLPRSKFMNEEINTGLMLTGAAGLLFGFCFVVFVGVLSPKLSFIQNPLLGTIFVLFSGFSALNILIESIFLAYRRTHYTLAINSIHSSLKLGFPFLFIGMGPIGIFAAAALAQGIGFILGLILVVKRFGYRPHLRFYVDVVQRIWRYSTVNYTASVFNLLPMSVLPIIITNQLGATSAAYFYISMMVGNLLYVIPWSIARSLFAEGSHNEDGVRSHAVRSFQINTLLLLPAVLAVVVFSPFVLGIFGHDYANESSVHFLWLIALSAIPIAVTSSFNALLQIKKDTSSILLTNVIYSIGIIGITFFLLPWDLNGVGIAWLVGNSIAAAGSALLYLFGDIFWKRVRGGTYVPRTIFTMKKWSLCARIFKRSKRKVLLCYPELPRWYHTLSVIAHRMGYVLTNDPQRAFDAAIAFEDSTFKHSDAVFSRLQQTQKFVNGRCLDISKQRVETIFSSIFGYGISIDPRTHNGECVQKSNENTAHDGRVIMCPCEPEEGYIYQKLVNNVYDETFVQDIRVIIYGSQVSFVILKYKRLDDRFDNTQSIEVVASEEALSRDERDRIEMFCKEFGLEYGELDILRDKDDSRIYIVDANVTCGSPLRGIHLTSSDYRDLIDKHANAFAHAFLDNLHAHDTLNSVQHGTEVQGVVSHPMRLFTKLFLRLVTGTYVPRTIITMKLIYFLHGLRQGFVRKVILTYPDKPRWYHTFYLVAHSLGYKLTNDPREHYDGVISFEDATFKRDDAILEHLRSSTHVINGTCMDISKERVNRTFEEIFEYPIAVDPRTHVGVCVKKSNLNAQHDGVLVSCPCEPEDGYVYQKLVNPQEENGLVRDMRILIYREAIPYMYYRLKRLDCRFDKTQYIEVSDSRNALSTSERVDITRFCERLGLEYGELDILRDQDDGRIYIVDANLTAGGPLRGIHLSPADHDKFLEAHSSAFRSAFMSASSPGVLSPDTRLAMR